MSVCWAKCLGDCSPIQSGEHIVSKSVYSGEALELQGFKWCTEKPVKIGKASAKANILCKTHNSGLSPLDDAGKTASDAFRGFAALTETRQKMKPRIWTVKTFSFPGLPFERWCLKTLINFCFERDHPIGRDGTVPGMPSDRLVRIAYGLDSFKSLAGLYSVTQVGMNIHTIEKVQFMPLMKHGINVEAGIFTFWGVTYLLFLEEEGPPRPLTDIYMNSDHLGDATITFHAQGIDMKLGKYVSHRLRINW